MRGYSSISCLARSNMELSRRRGIKRAKPYPTDPPPATRRTTMHSRGPTSTILFVGRSLVSACGGSQDRSGVVFGAQGLPVPRLTGSIARWLDVISTLCMACHRSQSIWSPARTRRTCPTPRASLSAVSGVPHATVDDFVQPWEGDSEPERRSLT